MDYKGFYIDEDISDHSVDLIHKEYGIKKTFRTTYMAQQYVDGWTDREKYQLTKTTANGTEQSQFTDDCGT